MLTIRSFHSDATFTLEYERDDYWRARLEGPDVTAEHSVYAYMGEGIVDFFKSLARDWRGWDGVRSWSSLEGDLSIDASCDRLGHTTLVIQITPDPVGGWSGRGSLVLDAADLVRLPEQVAALVQR